MISRQPRRSTTARRKAPFSITWAMLLIIMSILTMNLILLLTLFKFASNLILFYCYFSTNTRDEPLTLARRIRRKSRRLDRFPAVPRESAGARAPWAWRAGLIALLAILILPLLVSPAFPPAGPNWPRFRWRRRRRGSSSSMPRNRPTARRFGSFCTIFRQPFRPACASPSTPRRAAEPFHPRPQLRLTRGRAMRLGDGEAP